MSLNLSGRVQLIGKLDNVICPTCKKTTVMPVVEKSLTKRIFTVPALKFRKGSFAICSFCGAKFRLTKDTVRIIRHHPEKQAAIRLVPAKREKPLVDFNVNW